jgi:hypothetical protein
MMPISKLCASAIGVLAFGTLVGTALAGEDAVIVTRAEWGAKPPALKMPPNVPTHLTIHHTGEKQNFGSSLVQKLKSLQAFSQSKSKLADGRAKPPWGDIPYHFYIDVKGEIGEGREVKYVGDTNTDYDPTGHVSIVVEGNFEREKPTPAEVEALENLLVDLAKEYHLGVESIDTHQDFAATACPGKYLLTLLPDIKADVAKRLAAAK